MPSDILAVEAERNHAGYIVRVFSLYPEMSGDFPLLTDVELVARGFRGAVLSHARNARLPLLSGHQPDGSPLDRPHLMIVPVALTADRAFRIAGVLAMLPNAITSTALAVNEALERWGRSGARLVLGRIGAYRVTAADPHIVDQEPTFAKSYVWQTVTPIALDRNPGQLWQANSARAARARAAAVESISAACERSGLARPILVELARQAFSSGIPSVAEFAPFPRDRAKTQRVCVHARLQFAAPISGPVLLAGC